MPKKRITKDVTFMASQTPTAHAGDGISRAGAAGGGIGKELHHTVTAFYQHLNDKNQTKSNEIDQLNSIIRPQKVAQH